MCCSGTALAGAASSAQALCAKGRGSSCCTSLVKPSLVFFTQWPLLFSAINFLFQTSLCILAWTVCHSKCVLTLLVLEVEGEVSKSSIGLFCHLPSLAVTFWTDIKHPSALYYLWKSVHLASCVNTIQTYHILKWSVLSHRSVCDSIRYLL